MCIFKKKPVVSPEKIKPTSSEKIRLAEIASLLKNYEPMAQIIMADNWKYLCSYNDTALFLIQDETNKMEYKPEEYDCDDFTFRLKGQFSIPLWSNLALGICWTTTHALNCFISEGKKVLFIEPQTDEIKSFVEGIKLFIM